MNYHLFSPEEKREICDVQDCEGDRNTVCPRSLDLYSELLYKMAKTFWASSMNTDR